MAWDQLKEKIKQGAISFHDGNTAVPGTFAFEATLPEMAMPLGFIWWRWGCGWELEIAYIWTHEDVRRADLATCLLDALIERLSPMVVSTGQCNEMSEPWCIRNGFVYDAKRSYWVRETPGPQSEMPKAVEVKKPTRKRQTNDC